MTHEEIEEYLLQIESMYEDLGPSNLESLVDIDIPNLIEIIRRSLNYCPYFTFEDLTND